MYSLPDPLSSVPWLPVVVSTRHSFSPSGALKIPRCKCLSFLFFSVLDLLSDHRRETTTRKSPLGWFERRPSQTFKDRTDLDVPSKLWDVKGTWTLMHLRLRFPFLILRVVFWSRYPTFDLFTPGGPIVDRARPLSVDRITPRPFILPYLPSWRTRHWVGILPRSFPFQPSVSLFQMWTLRLTRRVGGFYP